MRDPSWDPPQIWRRPPQLVRMAELRRPCQRAPHRPSFSPPKRPPRRSGAVPGLAYRGESPGACAWECARRAGRKPNGAKRQRMQEARGALEAGLARPGTGPGPSRVLVVREFGFQDWLVLTYLAVLVAVVLLSPHGGITKPALRGPALLLAVAAAALALVRSRLIQDGLLAPLLYRVGVYGTVQASYFSLAALIPLATERRLDESLYRLDLHLLGYSPAMAWQHWATPTVAGWFSFFYFSYFLILGAYVIPMLLLVREQVLVGELALGLLVVVCLGHTTYLLVPAYGPYIAYTSAFEQPLPAGLWMRMVRDLVASGGAMLDVFPSLHTALPCFIALYAFRHRRRPRFRYTWGITAFFALNIVISTMLLRWHYFVDILAGLALAGIAFAVAVHGTKADLARRAHLNLMANWPPFDWGAVWRRSR